MERALGERRVLITEDSDFGELVYARGRPSVGVVLVKFDNRARRAKPAAVVEAVEKLRERCEMVSRSLNLDGCGWPGERKGNFPSQSLQAWLRSAFVPTR
jgi:hypothetical protein